MTRWIWASLVGTVAGVVAPASAAPFYMEFDPAKGFPEDQQWIRVKEERNGSHARFIDDSALTLDTRNSVGWEYHDTGPMAFHLDGHERLIVEWTMQTLESTIVGYNADAGVLVYGPSGGAIEILISPSWVSIVGENAIPRKVLDLAGSDAHVYRIETSDLSSFTLYVDQIPVATDTFPALGNYPLAVQWGDVVKGLSSRTRWIDLSVTVVPEPPFCASALAVLILGRRVRCGHMHA